MIDENCAIRLVLALPEGVQAAEPGVKDLHLPSNNHAARNTSSQLHILLRKIDNDWSTSVRDLLS